MQLNRNLLKNRKKSIFRLVLGILFWGITVHLLFDRIIEEQSPTIFNWFYFGIFAINAILHSAEGLGYNLARLFGKACIQIDQDKIVVKTNIIDKAETTFWDNIESIEYQPSRLKAVKKDNTFQIIDYSGFSYELVQDIKEAINSIAPGKGVIIK